MSMDKPNYPGEYLSGGGSAREPRAAPRPTDAQGEQEMRQMGTGHGGAMPGGMDCAGMTRADVTVENTPDGAVLRFRAKERADVSRIQRMAHQMERCMRSGGAGDRTTEQK
jgi:hypothetical protein